MIAALLLAAVLAAPARPAAAEPTDEVRIATERLEVTLALEGARPVTWRACRPSCLRADAGVGIAVRLVAPGDGSTVRLSFDGHPGPVILDRLRFDAEPIEDARTRGVTLRADLPVDGVRLEQSYALARDGYDAALTVRLVGPGAAAYAARVVPRLEIVPGHDIGPSPAAGFGALLERVGPVMVADGAAGAVPTGSDTPRLGAGEWAGVRGRFWGMLARPDHGVAVQTMEARTAIRLTARPADGSSPAPAQWRYTIYAGPIERAALRATDPVLGALLLSGLWWWLRALALGLLALLRALTAVLGHPGVAIIGLAVSVKLLLLPLARVADRLQEQVNATQARLQPGLEAINAAHRGEERTRRTLALYRAHGVHPLYALRSLVGFLIQIPVFIAVFDMLAEDIDLSGVSFLWIRDLAHPDAVASLPACVPFFGCALNLLPFLMSGVSLATTLRFRSSVLTPALVSKQRRNLTGMTGLFFLLVYTVPAGMVLYWTSTNAFQLMFQELGRRWRERRAPAPAA